MAPYRRIGRLTAHLWPAQSAGGDGDGSDDEDGSDEDDDFLLLDDDDDAFGDDDLADMLAAFDDVEGGDDEDDMFELDEPGEDELLEQLRDPDPSVFNAAAVALRKLWREREGPFAADELDAAVGHLRRRVQSRGGALKAIETAASALRTVVEEYPDWAEPLNELATCELLRANSDESVRLGRQVLEMQPNHFDCLARLCLSYAITGDDSEGEAAVESLESVCPGLASPIRQLATALSAALQQAANNGEGSSRPEQIRLEIDPATLETLGPILQGMGGFGDAMQGGLGGAGEGAAAEEEEEEEEEGEEGGDGGGGGGVAGTLHVRFYLHAFAAGQEPLEPMGLPHDAYGFQVRPANVGAYQAHLRSVEQDAPMWLAQWNSLMRGVASDAELPAEARSLATSVLSRGVPPQHRPHVWLCLTGARELMQRSARGGRDYWQLAAAAEGAVPHDIRRQVEYDLPRTFPQHADFMPGGGGGGGDGASARVDTPALASLRRVLLAFAMYEPSVGYCQSLNFVAAMLILVGGEEGGFWMLAAICANVIPDYHTHQMTGLRIDTQAAMTRTHAAHALHVPCTCSTPLHAHCCLTTATRAPRTVQAVATLVGATLPKLEAHFNSLGVPLEILASQARSTYYYGCTYCYGYT